MAWISWYSIILLHVLYNCMQTEAAACKSEIRHLFTSVTVDIIIPLNVSEGWLRACATTSLPRWLRCLQMVLPVLTKFERYALQFPVAHVITLKGANPPMPGLTWTSSDWTIGTSCQAHCKRATAWDYYSCLQGCYLYVRLFRG